MTDERKKEIEEMVAKTALPSREAHVLRVYVQPVGSSFAIKTDAFGWVGIVRIMFRESEDAEYALPFYSKRIEERDEVSAL